MEYRRATALFGRNRTTAEPAIRPSYSATITAAVDAVRKWRKLRRDIRSVAKTLVSRSMSGSRSAALPARTWTCDDILLRTSARMRATIGPDLGAVQGHWWMVWLCDGAV